jgi:uncharacterized membrane protein HdeD (DUF308 family)
MSNSAPRQLANLGTFKPPVENEFTQTAKGGEFWAFTNLEKIISNTIGIMTVLAGLFFIYQFVIAALNWVTSAGEKGKLESARTQMLNAAIGLILVVGAYAIIGLVGRVVGLDLLEPAKMLKTLVPQ